MNKYQKRGLGIVYKLIGMSVLPVLILGIILTLYGQSTLRSNIKKEINNGLHSTAVAVSGSYSAAGTGDFTMLESGNVIKGMFVVSKNYSLMDEIKADTQTDTALYFGEKLVVTSLTDESGNRIEELAVDDDVKNTVLTEGKEFFSENIKIGNDTYFGYYMPVVNEDGSIGGMIFAGKNAASINATVRESAFRMLLLSIILMVIAAILTSYMALAIAKALKKTIKMLDKVSSGDLRSDEETGKNAESNRDDEVGRMLNGIVGLRSYLQDMIGNIHSTSEKLANWASGMEDSEKNTGDTSQSVESAVREISSGAMSQAKETEAAMIHIEKMGNQIEQIVDDIRILSEKSKDIEETSESVDSIIHELGSYTQRTTAVIGEISHQTEVTNASAHEIQSAVEIIQSIAEETNLLSLNASIEAARAGEHGRGFAVVADQIQKLAEQSNQSAQQIEKIIETLLEDSERSVQTMGEVVEIVGSQEGKLQETEEGFLRVNAGIRESINKIGEIRDKSQIIDDSRNEIMGVITNLSAISEENASVAQETADSAVRLNSVVEKMTKEAAALKELASHLEGQIDSFTI